MRAIGGILSMIIEIIDQNRVAAFKREHHAPIATDRDGPVKLFIITILYRDKIHNI
jgi:hypothetical protein